MIKLYDLYTRIVETTGLDVLTLGSLKAALANCMADLRSRGYKTFKENHLSDFKSEVLFLKPIEQSLLTDDQLNKASNYASVDEKDYYYGQIIYKYDELTSEIKYYIVDKKEELTCKVNQNWVELDVPKDMQKAVYLRLYFPTNATLASRWSLSNKRVACNYINGEFRSMLEPGQAIYYTKADKLYIEWHSSLGETLEEISFGYYQKLTMPSNFPDNPDDARDMNNCYIDIRPEFEDALVFYAAYFYYSRYVKDTDKIQHYLSQYKYYIEDITHELSYEDEFNEEDAVIKLED